MEKPLHTVDLNSGHIEIYKNSIVFYDHTKEEMFEYDYAELYEIADGAR